MKYFYAVFLLFSLLSYHSLCQSLADLEMQIANMEIEIKNARNQLNEIDLKYPRFRIAGEIKDRNKDLSEITIWGIAIPISNNYNEYGTLLKEGNIIVYNPESNNVDNGSYWQGEHYFIEKTYGKNAFGMEVPVYIYGGLLNTKDKNKMNSLKKELPTKEKQLADYLKQKENIILENLVNEGDKLFSDKMYEASIQIFKKLLDYKKNYYKIKIAETYGILADDNVNNKEYNNAISNYSNAILYDPIQKYFRKKATAYKKLGDENLFNNGYAESIYNYETAIGFDPDLKELLKPTLASAYFKKGRNYYDIGQYLEAMSDFNESFSLDNNYKNEIEPLISLLRKPPFLYATCSIIPGLGQLLQGKTQKSLIHFSLFSASLISSILFNNSSKNSFAEYEKATNSDDATNLFAEANKRKQYSNIAIGIAAGTIIWSILDSFSEASNNNKPFYLSYNYNSNLNAHNLSIAFLYR